MRDDTGTIERAPSPRFVGSIAMARDVALSADARSLAFYLASIQPDETFTLNSLGEMLGMTPERIDRAFRELTAGGYALPDGSFLAE